jgi:hypothetical protein
MLRVGGKILETQTYLQLWNVFQGKINVLEWQLYTSFP